MKASFSKFQAILLLLFALVSFSMTALNSSAQKVVDVGAQDECELAKAAFGIVEAFDALVIRKVDHDLDCSYAVVLEQLPISNTYLPYIGAGDLSVDKPFRCRSIRNKSPPMPQFY